MMITTREVTYVVDGLRMIAHLAQPDSPGPWPAVLIGHDGVGLEEYQRQRADDLAAHGYLALAMDYHGGEVFFDQPAAMLARVMPLLADVERMQAIGRAALDLLLAQAGVDPDRIAALGYGAGGQIVLELARTGVPFKAIAVVHPAFPDAKAEDWANVTGAFLLCTGSEDPLCTPQQVLDFGSALQEVGADWRVNIYGGAEHAFWAQPRNPDGSFAEGDAHTMTTVPGVSYHPEHTPHAWQAVLDLFGETF
ncbi:dienelactone hydrolase family protein [Parasphingorhabdus cellanae]|uniref:Dienelactone hydrolase family protein n=1 Tax=Parasphingorhabdus cellanae TaxID=2806553 RepID=A0ABX7TAS2_9SPHN|nr:dienelactone hydrolase family protein [Parasphingorhabdus cellanae]QTD57343.1 dienelactone hydrolase family protein [Parasphingorhabdus cellanae]